MQKSPGLDQITIGKFRRDFTSSEKNLLAQNVCATQPLWDVCRSRDVTQMTQHCFNHKLESEGKPVTDQKQSGRCWFFACLNMMRIPFMKKYKLEEFEFSTNYLFFWDKVERANYLLNAFIECARKGETCEGRLVHHLLRNPAEDGGQWDMLTSLVEKYGVVPKVLCPDTWNSENSLRLDRLVNNRLREYCMVLHKLVADGSSDDEIEKEKLKMVEEIYRLMSITLGSPPTSVTFQYYSKGTDGAQEHHCLGPLSPRDFYHQLVKPDCLDMEQMVCIVNDPRKQNGYDKLYTVEYLGNMEGGYPTLYINKPVSVLKQLAIKAITENKTPVWFGCDVGKCFSGKQGILDLNILDLKLMFGMDHLRMTKEERLMFGETLMTHAMLLTGVNTVTSDDGTVTADKWRVQNSWGDADGDKGYLVMTDDWFSEFVFEVVVNKSLLDEETLAILEESPVVLPAWDPMGALARA